MWQREALVSLVENQIPKVQFDAELTFIDKLEEFERTILSRLNDINGADLPFMTHIAFTKTRSESRVAHEAILLLQKVRAISDMH